MDGPKTEPLSLNAEDACRALGVGRSTFWKLMKDGEIPFFSVGRRRLITRDALAQFVRRHEQAGAAATGPAK